MEKKNLYLIIIITTLILISTVLGEITIVQENPSGEVILTTVDTHTATPISETTYTPSTQSSFDSDLGGALINPGYSISTYDYQGGFGCVNCGFTNTLPYGTGAGPALGGPVGGGSPTVTTTVPTPTYYDDGGYTPPYSPPCACSSGQVDVSANVCDGGCGLQVRTCDGCYWSAYTCDLNRRPAGLPTTETNCNDNIDNDCDNQADYDGGTIKNKGDSDCLISLSPLTVSVSNPNENDNTEEVTCIANAGNLKSIKASIDGVNCASSSSSGNNYKFRCNIGTVSESNPSKEVKCYVDTALSYLSGGESKTNIDVCKLLSASWSNPNARQYADVKLNVLTTPGCSGKEVKFFVKNLGTGRNASFAPRKTTIVNGKAESSWTVEFESLDGQNPLYYFTAIID